MPATVVTLPLPDRQPLPVPAVVQETASRLIPSPGALAAALRLVSSTAARWVLCAHTSTLGTTPSEVQHAADQIRQAGAELLCQVASAPPPASASFAQRLEEHMRWSGWDPVTLGRILGLDEEVISLYLAERLRPTEGEIASIAAPLGLDPAWLGGAVAHPKWGAEVGRIRRLIRRAPAAAGEPGPDEQMRQALRLAERLTPLSRNPWFLPGWLGVHPFRYRQFMRGACSADGVMRERLCAVLDLTPSAGEPEAVIISIPLEMRP